MFIELDDDSTLYVTTNRDALYSEVITPGSEVFEVIGQEVYNNVVFARHATTGNWLTLCWYPFAKKSLRLVDPHVVSGPFRKGMLRVDHDNKQLLMTCFGRVPGDWAEYDLAPANMRPSGVDAILPPRDARQVMFHGTSKDGMRRLVVMRSTFYPNDEVTYGVYEGASYLHELPLLNTQGLPQGDYGSSGDFVNFRSGDGFDLTLPTTDQPNATLNGEEYRLAAMAASHLEEHADSLYMRRSI